MSTSREGPNPLRPYYIPPSIGFPPDTPSPHTSSSTPNLRSNGTSYASSARDIFADIDYSDYVSDDSKGAMGMIQQMLDEAMHKYIAVLFAQPFDVAKTILQVKRNGPAVVAQETGREHGRRRSREEQYGDVRASTLLTIA